MRCYFFLVFKTYSFVNGKFISGDTDCFNVKFVLRFLTNFTFLGHFFMFFGSFQVVSVYFSFYFYNGIV